MNPFSISRREDVPTVMWIIREGCLLEIIQEPNLKGWGMQSRITQTTVR